MRNLSTLSELIDELNRLRVINKRKPLKSWKGSKEKAVDAIKAEVEVLKPKFVEPKVPTLVEEKPIEETPALVEKKPEVKEPVKTTSIEKPTELKETFTVVELAIELKISPKVARAKLRRTDNLPPKTGKGWTFANEVREALIKILS